MTVRKNRPRRNNPAMVVATLRRNKMRYVRRLELLVEFAQTELTAKAADRWGRELPRIKWRIPLPVVSLGPPGGEVRPKALRALQRKLVKMLDDLVSGSRIGAVLEIELDSHRVMLLAKGEYIERIDCAEWPDSFWLTVIETLENSGHRLARCLRPECQRLVVKTRRQRYCSSSCSQMVRSHRWYQAHRPEAQRRRREAYAKEVKTKYPRAKITTRPRHPRGR